jgi:hypothetical protein
MEVRDITGFRTDLLKREYKQTDQWNEHFLGYSHEEQFGFFKLMHGKKADIRGFLTKEVQMAEDGQAIYEFIQNAADCDATHCYRPQRTVPTRGTINGRNPRAESEVLEVAQ